MKLRQANSDKFKKRIKYYKGKKIEQLKSITPVWAYGKYSDKMLDICLHPKTEEYNIFLVDSKKLIGISELDEVNSNILFTGDILNDGRVATILYRWDNKEFIDPPIVEIFDRNKRKLCFSDGRHRTKTTYLLGHKLMPIAIHKSRIEQISKLIRLIPT